jgi:23S rRNA (guanosine2251-2'-O)-methyltransferase
MSPGRPPPRRRPDAEHRPPPSRRGPADFDGQQVEGRQAVRELLRANKRQIFEVFIESDRDPSPVLDEIAELARRQHVPVRFVGREMLGSLARTESAQGVVARAAAIKFVSVRDLCESNGANKVPPFLVVFDGVSDPRNLGAVLRSAVAAGANGAVLPTHRSASVTPTVAKTAAGAIEYLPIATVSGVGAALTDLRRLGVWTVGLDADGDTNVDSVEVFDQPVALVFGAEGRGLSPLARSRCDLVCRIPIVGALDSLNVSAAAAVALFSVSRRRGWR